MAVRKAGSSISHNPLCKARWQRLCRSCAEWGQNASARVLWNFLYRKLTSSAVEHTQLTSFGNMPRLNPSIRKLNRSSKYSCKTLNLRDSCHKHKDYKDPCQEYEDVTGLYKGGRLKEALQFLSLLNQQGSRAASYECVRLLQECGRTKALSDGREVHALITNSALALNIFVLSTLVSMYAKCGSLTEAREVFDRMPTRTAVSWNAMITGYTKHGNGKEALGLCQRMRREGIMPDRVTLICNLNACASLGDLVEGKLLRAEIVKAGLMSDVVVGNALIDMYAKCGSLGDAEEVFEKLPCRDVVSWNAMIAGYARNGKGEEAFNLYRKMRVNSFKPDRVTFVGILGACASLGALEKGKQVHGEAVEAGLECDVFVGTALVDMYAKCGSIVEASEVFKRMPRRDVASWNALIAGYAKLGNSEEALTLCEQMKSEGLKLDRATFLGVLSACANLESIEKGKQFHAEAVEAGYETDLYVGNALIDMYAKCGSLFYARQVFQKMSKKDVISWTAMIAAYVGNGSGAEAFNLYKQMKETGLKPDEVTFSLILSACAGIPSLEKGKQVHSDAIEAGLAFGIFVGTALVDMYAKCGNVTDARAVFDEMPARNVVSWNAMIAGYASHGDKREAFTLFKKMLKENVKPNEATLVSVLSVCSHLGLVDEGRRLFYSMPYQYGLSQTLEHFGCMIDLFGRAGLLVEAFQLMKEAPGSCDVSQLTAMLGACRTHGNLEIAEQVTQWILSLEPQNTAAYVLLSSIYAAAGKRDENVKLRKLMKTRGVRKEPGRAGLS
ncbi:hypothetical protein O6H91_07G102400 [Diphasiastrum complanatum]|uniref:Uncharacterized protein n=4 Tax=Diphasiastrum complanatum TaxID=34168 RepID=A0ACC2D8C1_DIPCM|nr:hypothetical protein O6H91_07G102400 [Diphasiastrum complanatum]